MNPMKGVYIAISLVQEELARIGIGKKRQNQQQGYSFRGIDDVYNELAPLLAKFKLCILPRVINRTVSERNNKNGTAIFSVTVECEFDFVCAEDGSCHTVKTFGEAMDSGDKATNKAMSAAFKYACMQAFCIPTEGDNDGDATSHEVSSTQSKSTYAKSQSVTERPTSALTGQVPSAGKIDEYHERIRAALRSIFGSDRETALSHVQKLSEWRDKETGEIKAVGLKDYRKLSPKRLEILCHTLEKEVKSGVKSAVASTTGQANEAEDINNDIIPWD
jgi:hypothetical protein